MSNFKIAVKSFIVNRNKELLIIKRVSNDLHSPGIWEIPGGRLKEGEDPFEGLKRETKEETDLNITILNPISVHHFTRDDGQNITMITFYCNPLTEEVKLSEEHTEYLWVPIENANQRLAKEFHKDVEIFQRFFLRD